MAKRNSIAWQTTLVVINAVFLIAILSLLVFAYWMSEDESGLFTFSVGDTTVNVPTSSSTSNQNQVPDLPEANSLCSIYVDNYPTYFDVKEAQCDLAGGDFVCDSGAIGCYNIGSWNSSLCTSGDPQVQALKASCLSLEGDFTCTATELSCER